MSTIKVNSISDAAGANGNAITLASDGTCTAKITNNLSHRNLIINGSMIVSQRGTSSTSSGYKAIDRWPASWSGGGVTQAQVDITSGSPFDAGFRKSLKLTNTTGAVGVADYRDIRYQVEAQDLACSGWDSVSTSSNITISFWAKASVAQTYYCFHYVPDSTKHYVWSFALSADTWTKVTKTIPGASGVTINNDNGAGLSIQISLFYGTDYTASGVTLNTWQGWSGSNRTPDMTNTWANTTNAEFEVTGIQLEVGDTATDFEHRSYGDELLKCQRYYFHQGSDSDYGFAISDNDNQWFDAEVVFPVQMRAAPSAVTNSGTVGDYSLRRDSTKTVTGGPNFNTAGTQAGVVRYGCSSHGWGTGAVVRTFPNDADAFIGWSAEL